MLYRPRSSSTFWVLGVLVNVLLWAHYILLPSHFVSNSLSSTTFKGVDAQYENLAMPAPHEPIALTLVLIGSAIVQEGSVAIKSALMHASRPVEFHLICTEDVVPVLDALFAHVKRPFYPIRVRYYTVTKDALRERSERAGIGSNWSVLSKLYIQEILQDVEKVIYIDTDAIFVVDPVQLWDDFSKFNSTNAVSFPTLGRSSHAGRICTCVMLLHLGRMRGDHMMWMPSTLLPSYTSPAATAFAAASVDGVPDPNDIGSISPFEPLSPWFADQGIFHIIWTYHPDLFRHLSLRWDLTHCRGPQYGLELGQVGDPHGPEISEEEHLELQKDHTESGEGLIVPGILHFNCLPDAGDDVWSHPDTYERGTWAAMVTTAARYKWVWLNRGDGSAKLTRETVSVVRFLDQQLAEEAQ